MNELVHVLAEFGTASVLTLRTIVSLIELASAVIDCEKEVLLVENAVLPVLLWEFVRLPSLTPHLSSFFVLGAELVSR